MSAQSDPLCSRTARRSQRRPGPACLSLLALLALATSCSTVEVSSSNLDEIHGPGGRYRYRAHLNTPGRYLMQRLLDPVIDHEERWAFGTPLANVEDPADVCLENLLELAETHSQRPSVLANQVRTYAWLAVQDPSGLVRERALLELGPHALRLGLQALPPALDARAAVNPPAFLEAVRGLYEVVRPVLARGERASETETADFLAALELLGQFQYDVEGGRRLLKAIAILSERSSSRSPSLAPLYRLSDQVQRQLAGEALRAGLLDENDRARAAAYEAATLVFGPEFLYEALLSLSASMIRLAPNEPTRFGLPPLGKLDAEVYVRVAQLVMRDGLPLPGGADELRARQARLAGLRTLLTVAVNHTQFDERAQVAAMLALQALRPEGPRTLRSEEWWDWWSAYSSHELEQLRALGESPQRPVQGEPSAGASSAVGSPSGAEPRAGEEPHSGTEPPE